MHNVKRQTWPMILNVLDGFPTFQVKSVKTEYTSVLICRQNTAFFKAFLSKNQWRLNKFSTLLLAPAQVQKPLEPSLRA